MDILMRIAMGLLVIGALAFGYANRAHACDPNVDKGCNVGQAGSVDGSLNTNSGNNNSNNTDQSVNDSTIVTNNNGNEYNQTGGTQVIETGPANTTNTTHTKVDTNQVGNAILSNLITGGQDVCLGSATGGLTIPGLGAIGGGSTIRDENCELIKQVKLLASLGLKDAAVCLMYQRDVTFKQAISSAYPQLVDLCDPEAKERKEKEDLLQKYIDAGLEPPKHLLGEENNSNGLQEGEWINDQGRVCSIKKLPILGRSTVCK